MAGVSHRIKEKDMYANMPRQLGTYGEGVGADETFGPAVPTAQQTTMQLELDTAKAQYQRLILWGFVGVIGLATFYYYNYGE